MTIYGGCESTSLSPNFEPPGTTAKPGYCENECDQLLGGYAIIFVNMLLDYGSMVIIPTILVRSIREEGKPLVLANRQLISKLLGA